LSLDVGVGVAAGRGGLAGAGVLDHTSPFLLVLLMGSSACARR
jgi:hypothetical protein